MNDYVYEVFIDYGTPLPLEGQCDECYAYDVVLKPIVRIDWQEGVDRIGATLKCTNCGRKVSSYWG